MAGRKVVGLVAIDGSGYTQTDLSISALNAARANARPDGNLDPQTHLLPAYVAENSRNTYPRQDGGR